MKFAQRSSERELLDEDDIPFEAIAANMRELDTINTLLGGHKITIDGFRRLLGKQQSVSICEIGCGGGDNLAAIARWCSKNNISLEATGIDIKESCTSFASSRSAGNFNFITSDYRDVHFEHKPDIIFSSLFCHHFSYPQLVEQLQWMKENSRIGFFINDLQRHPLAYYSIRLLTWAFSKSYLVKNDAPISVLRGFHKKELQELCAEVGLRKVAIEWKWAFRYLLVYRHD